MGDIPFMTVGNAELEGQPPIPEYTPCHICGTQCAVRYGEVLHDDGTRSPSDIACIHCDTCAQSYLVGMHGVMLPPPSMGHTP